jgi:hypothetical protein
MFKITKTYTDYNGEEKTENFWFNLDKFELAELLATPSGGLDALLEKVVNTNDTATIVRTFKEIILKAYGEKTPDGRFVKIDDAGHPLSVRFSQTAVFPELFMELAFDSEKAANFINGCMPADMKKQTSSVLSEVTGDIANASSPSTAMAALRQKQQASRPTNARD